MTRRAASLAIFLGALSGCRVPLADGARFRAGATAETLGQGLLSAGVVLGTSLYFPGAAGSSGGIEWDVKIRAAVPSTRPFVAQRSTDGALSMAVMSSVKPTSGTSSAPSGPEPLFSVKIDGSPGSHRIVASTAKVPQTAVSPAGEDVRSFDFFLRDNGLYIAWSAVGIQDRPIRFASLDVSGAPRHLRVPFDAEIAYLTAPSLSPLGLTTEGAVVVAYDAAPSAGVVCEVRVSRLARGDDGLARAGAPKPAAPGFVWSRSPRVRASYGGGVVVFEGLPFEGGTPAIYATSLSSSGDPVGAPNLLLAIRGESSTRSHATPLFAANEWFLAYEETRDGDAVASLKLLPLSTD